MSHCRTVSSGMREIQTCKIKKINRKLLQFTGKCHIKQETTVKPENRKLFSVALSHCFLIRAFQNCATKNSADMPDSDLSFNKSAYFSDMKKAVFTPINVNTAFSQHLKIRIFNWWRRCIQWYNHLFATFQNGKIP